MARPNSPSLEKTIPALGYVPGNVLVMSSKANMMKQDATLNELILMGKWAEHMKCQLAENPVSPVSLAVTASRVQNTQPSVKPKQRL